MDSNFLYSLKPLCIKIIFVLALVPAACFYFESVPEGAYQYTGYDSTGAAGVGGWFTVTFLDSTNFKGEWHFHKAALFAPNCGPQIGDDSLVGSLSTDSVEISLNSRVRDSNVYLRGKISGDLIQGQWNWYSLTGLTEKGTFQAVKR